MMSSTSSPVPLFAGQMTDDRLGPEPLVGDDLVEHRQRVVVQGTSRLGELGVGQHLGEPRTDAPCAEERRPVDVRHQFGDVVVVENSDPGERWRGDRRRIERRLEPVRSRLFDRDTVTLGVGSLVRLHDTRVVDLQIVEEPGAQVGRHQVRDHAGCAAGIGDVDDRSVVGGIDLQARVQPAGGGPTDQQGHLEPGALHLAGDPDHLVERRRDQAGQTDHVDVALARRLEDRLGGHHHTEVDDFVVRTAEHDADDVLADVVHVALHRGEQHGAGLRTGVLAALGLDERGEIGHGLLHHACRTSRPAGGTSCRRRTGRRPCSSPSSTNPRSRRRRGRPRCGPPRRLPR